MENNNDFVLKHVNTQLKVKEFFWCDYEKKHLILKAQVHRTVVCVRWQKQAVMHRFKDLGRPLYDFHVTNYWEIQIKKASKEKEGKKYSVQLTSLSCKTRNPEKTDITQTLETYLSIHREDITNKSTNITTKKTKIL